MAEDVVGLSHFDAYRATLLRLLGSLSETALEEMAAYLARCHGHGGRIWVLGNGGSSANASHLVLHLRAAGCKANNLLDGQPNLTALANDHSYDSVPLKLLRSQGIPGDALVVISGSGDSSNVIVALAEATRVGMTTLGILGFNGGAARTLCRFSLIFDCREYGPLEDVHSAVIHLLSALLTNPAECGKG